MCIRDRAYAELLQRDPEARPGSIDEDEVEEIKGRLVDVWLQLSREERQLAETVPAVWSTCLLYTSRCV